MSVFLKNCRYIAAWSHEVPSGGMLARQIAGEHVLLLRDAADNVAAVSETCPHRFAPLGLGSCADGVVTCPYHGLRFDASGACVENPPRRIAGRDFWSLRPALLPSDKGGVLVRRAFDAMLAAEAQRETAE